jgi:hypothetical protein
MQESVHALGVLLSMRYKKKLPVEKCRKTYLLDNQAQEKWIEDYVERETTGARKRVDNAESAVQP